MLYSLFHSLLLTMLLIVSSCTADSGSIIKVSELPAGCHTGTKDGAGVHSALLPKTLELLLNKSGMLKTRQLVECDGRAYTLFLYDFGNEEDAKMPTSFSASNLWGPGGPHDDEKDGLFTKEGKMLVVSPEVGPFYSILAQRGFKQYGATGKTAAIAPKSENREDLNESEIASYEKTLECDKRPDLPYCVAIKKFRNGKPISVTQSKRLIGFSVMASLSKPGAFVEELSYLVLSPDKGKYGSLLPENLDEEREIKKLILLLKSGKSIPPAHPFLSDVRGFRIEPLGASVTVGNSSLIKLKSHTFIRQYDNSVIVIEQLPGTPTMFYLGVFQL